LPHSAGLAHFAFRNSDHQMTSVCLCSTCCCEVLGELTAQTYKTGVVTSAYVATFDADTCVGCGTCIDRCQFAAFSRDPEDNTIAFNTDRCLGCGLCVSTCPVGAIGFVER